MCPQNQSQRWGEADEPAPEDARPTDFSSGSGAIGGRPQGLAGRMHLRLARCTQPPSHKARGTKDAGRANHVTRCADSGHP